MKLKSFLVLPLLLGAACGTISNLQSATPKQAEHNAPAHAASSANVTLGASPEAITITPRASGAENYFEASIDYIGTINYAASARDDGVYRVTLTENANDLNYSGEPLNWAIRIDPAIPLSLDVHSSSGALSLDLRDFTVTDLHADTSSGAVNVTLPATDQPYQASINTSSGAVTATVADNAQINFTTMKTSSGSITLNTGSASNVSADIETSSGDIKLNVDANVDAEITFRSSSGAVTVDVPEGAAVRLEIAQNSSGGVNVPGWLRQVSGDNKTGVWESDGFETAEHQVFITVTRVSSGAVTVQ